MDATPFVDIAIMISIAVLNSLQNAHDAEATASERWHKQEHEFEQGELKIPGLVDFYDKLHGKAFKRQHRLRNSIMMLGGDVDTTVGDTSYYSDPAKSFQVAHDVLTDLLDKHQTINEATRTAADKTKDGAEKAVYRGIREKYHKTVKKIHKQIHKVEQKQAKLNALGLPLFIAKHS